MQSILNIFKSRYFWIGFGFLLLIALTLILGAWLGWSMITRLLIVIGLLLVCIGIVVFEFVRASRSAQQIEESIKMQAEQQRMQSRPDRQPEIEELQERLEKAINTLKKSSLGRGRRSSNALYALPWYMVIGPPGAGKTTAVKNSGLNFPVGTDRVRGVGGTRNCDWFFTDQAILLDTAGRYMTEHEDEEEWHAFLDMLKEHRTHRPINGILVGISINELVEASPDEIEWHANNIRRRISELVERLGVRFPVYLVFTKCDLLQGFVEFFGDMTRQEREQIWGCTLTDEQREEGTLRTVFEHEFDRLYDALIDVRADRLSRSMKREERRRVYVFPLEFASAKENLSLFIDQLFQRNPYQENPEFRGFYFTSGTQEGAPIDRVIQSISEQFDFASGIETGTEPDREKKSYFIKDLFTDVIIPDQYMVEQTASSVRRGRFMRWGMGAAAALLLALFVVGLSQALVRSQLDLNRMEDAAQAAASVQWTSSGNASLEPINQLRREIVQLEDYEDDPPFMRWGLYRGSTVLDPARSLYYQKMRPLVREHFKALEQRLSQQDVSSLNEQARRNLRAELENYLLLSDSSRALDRRRYREQLSQYLTDRMTQAAPTGAGVSFQGQQGQIEQHMNAFVDGLSRQQVRPFQARSALVERLIRAVQQPPTIGRIYARIKRQGDTAVPTVTLSDILGQSSQGLSLFATRPTVSGFFTKQGWENFVKEEIQKAAKTPGQGGLIGGSSAQLSEELRNSEKVAQQLKDRYFAEYVTTWKEFLNRLEYDPQAFAGIRSAAQNLQVLGSEYESPLNRILARATAETTFESRLAETAQNLQDEAERRAQGAARRATGARGQVVEGSSEDGTNVHPVNSQMRWLHRLKANKAQSGGAARDMVQALKALRTVGVKLDGMRNDPKRAYDFAKRILSENGGLMERQMRALRDALSQFSPQARREIFESPILGGWQGVLNETQQYLNERWRQNVYQYYQSNLAGTYPFASESDQDAPLRHVQTFFQPEKGIVDTYVRKHLDAFLRDDENQPETWEGRGISFSSSAARMLDKAEGISNELVSGGALRWRFELQPDVPTTEGNAPSPGEVFARIHGTTLRYTLGFQPRVEFVWPGETGALLRIQTQEGPMEPKQWEGPWAWFRMLDEAQVEPQTATKYRIRWRFAHSSGRYSVTARYNLWSQTASELITQKPSGFFRFPVPQTLD